MSQAGRRENPGLEAMLGKMQLRELLTEVSDRVAEIVEVRDRLDRLIEARLMVASNLDLDETLRRIVHAAVELDTPLELDIELGGSPPAAVSWGLVRNETYSRRNRPPPLIAGHW